ncbi:ATP phosphoribosyltransferase [Canibacter zhoujuaniae]|uniref:ATP phosphoribosyltransferase n=1 Tax=Canibacter zhoujuaniae TaxID=2708343 RepID=UPI00141F39D3|nr:ATP phosphoribosyltransferase [Canibacter zhoujuaniae]
MLRIAVPNKGSLSETAAQMLTEAGYRGRRDSRTLISVDERNGVEFFYLRPRDIATYVGSGAVDVGITGRDLLLDSNTEATEIRSLDFADSTFRFAAPATEITELAQLESKRVATSYPKLVGDFLAARGISAKLVKLEGAVESAVRLGVADAVADVVSTGATLRAAGLTIFGPIILESTAILIGTEPSLPQNNSATNRLLQRLEGVLVARKYVMLEYDLEAEKLEAATAISPGMEAPTVSPLSTAGWVAVRVMVPSDETAPIMDRLHELGAKAIIVTSIHAARI